MFKKYLSFIGICFALFLFFTPVKVHAADSFPLPEKYWSNRAFDFTFPDGIDYENFCNDFFEFSGLKASDYFLIVATGTAVYESGRMYIYPYERSSIVTAYSDSSHRYLYLKSYPTTIYYCNNSTLNGFGSMSYSQFSRYPRSFCFDNTNQVYRQCVLQNNGSWENLEYNDIPLSVINQTAPPPYSPSYDGFYSGLNLDINTTDFYDWLISTNKYAELPEYIGTSKLMSFIEFYKQFGGSNSNFFKQITDWFKFMNIANQTNSNINILKTTMDKLYQEYLSDYIVNGYSNSANQAHHRHNIQTNTDDDNTTLITDDPSDSTDTSILRDILRGIINISNSIAEQTDTFVRAIKNINFTVNVSNDGGTTPAPTIDTNIDYTDQGDFGIDEIHQYEPLPEAPDIDGDVDFLEYPSVLAQSTNAFFNLLPSDMSALMSAFLVLGVLITKIGR